MATFTGTAGAETLTGAAENDLLQGLGGNDILEGGDGDDTFEGGAGNDTMYGGSGNDVFDSTSGSGTGNDKFWGGTGDDIYVVSGTDQINEASDAGTDLVRASSNFSIAAFANVENLTFTGSGTPTGTGNALGNVITGNDGTNTLNGQDGDDTLHGNLGNDTLNGGNGNDILYGGAGNDKFDWTDGTRAGDDVFSGGAGNDDYMIFGDDDVIEAANEGIDRIWSEINFSLVPHINVENLTLTGTTAVSATGNDLDNALTGNDIDNTLTGRNGDDTLLGDDGNDHLFGGAGDDVLNGGNGNDFLSGAASDDVLNGGSGNDFLSGGAGDDDYVVSGDDEVVEPANSGTDQISTDTSYSLATLVNFENLTLTGSTATDGTGNNRGNVLLGNAINNTLTGMQGNDTLAGGDGDDRLFGNEENDTLNGGNGNDYLVGGTGNDRFDFDNGTRAGADTFIGGGGNDIYVLSGNDVVVENGNAGIDQIYADTNYSLAELVHVENLALYGPALNATGNGLRNALLGNELNNRLTGADGDDTLIGDDGDDTLIGGAGDDSMNGGYGDDTLNGGAGDDLFDWENGPRAGADTFIGGGGNDVYVISGNDEVVENQGGGIDQIWAGTNFSLESTPNVENLSLYSEDEISGRGNALNNEIIGNNAANTLTGLAGHDLLVGGQGRDVLNGGGGNDTLIGGDDNDRLTGSSGEDIYLFNTTPSVGNVDTIVGFLRAQDMVYLDDDIFKRLATGEDHFLPAEHYKENGTGRATEGDDRIIYNTNNGSLYYDPDGSGPAAAVKFAVLTGAPDIDESNFGVVT